MRRSDTIVAVATPPGRGGIGIVRISGPDASNMASSLLTRIPAPGKFGYSDFLDGNLEPIDSGIALTFRAPHSFTGEDVLELHGHGSPIVLQMLVQRCLELGGRIARPGEFSERAYLNGQMDLAQAEAIADLIESQTRSAARLALRSLKGAFSDKVRELARAVTELRVMVEASIDFPDEEMELLDDEALTWELENQLSICEEIRSRARQGRVLRDGLRVVLIGPPNAGKSSLLNRMTGENRAIVSAVPGTTRDTLEQAVEVDGLYVEVVDTAGIRDTDNEIESEGVRRARLAQGEADLVLFVVDDAAASREDIRVLVGSQDDQAVLLVRNKVDISCCQGSRHDNEVCVSALTGQGMDELNRRIRAVAGCRENEAGLFLARQRHLDALERAGSCLKAGLEQQRRHRARELLAEDLAACQKSLGEITGEVSSDELLGLIFSTFCIGK